MNAFSKKKHIYLRTFVRSNDFSVHKTSWWKLWHSQHVCLTYWRHQGKRLWVTPSYQLGLPESPGECAKPWEPREVCSFSIIWTGISKSRQGVSLFRRTVYRGNMWYTAHFLSCLWCFLNHPMNTGYSTGNQPLLGIPTSHSGLVCPAFDSQRSFMCYGQ